METSIYKSGAVTLRHILFFFVFLGCLFLAVKWRTNALTIFIWTSTYSPELKPQNNKLDAVGNNHDCLEPVLTGSGMCLLIRLYK